MRTGLSVGLVVVAGLGLVGCSGARPYQRVDLSGNLSPDTLQRYEREWKDMQAEGREDGMARLEHTNWWLPGLLAYYRRATVMRSPSPNGPVYHITSGEGYGPLSILYANSTHATYNARGERLSGMSMYSVITGGLAMISNNDAVLPGGESQKVASMHLLHHLLNIHKMDGHTYVSFLTMPNPIGGELGHGDTAHGGHAH